MKEKFTIAYNVLVGNYSSGRLSVTRFERVETDNIQQLANAYTELGKEPTLIFHGWALQQGEPATKKVKYRFKATFERTVEIPTISDYQDIQDLVADTDVPESPEITYVPHSFEPETHLDGTIKLIDAPQP